MMKPDEVVAVRYGQGQRATERGANEIELNSGELYRFLQGEPQSWDGARS